jgi:hypothetical protein
VVKAGRRQTKEKINLSVIETVLHADSDFETIATHH